MLCAFLKIFLTPDFRGIACAKKTFKYSDENIYIVPFGRKKYSLKYILAFFGENYKLPVILFDKRVVNDHTIKTPMHMN